MVLAKAMMSLMTAVPARSQIPSDPASSASSTSENTGTEGISRHFFDVMGMFAASMGNDCTFCHVKEAGFRREAFAEATPRIQRARQMIVMMQGLNKQYFGGRPRVTCFTCHRGDYQPVDTPSFLIQYGVPTETEHDHFPTDAGYRPTRVRPVADAIGGREALARDEHLAGAIRRIRYRQEGGAVEI